MSDQALGDVAEIRQGRYLSKGEMSESRTAANPIPVHGANGIVGWTSRPMYNDGVALVTCRGSNSGMVLWAEGPLWVSNNAMAIVSHDGRHQLAFYALKNSPPHDVVSGSAQPQITRAALAPRRYSWPPEDQRDGIVAVLSALDNKIELNRRMNETLEASARALFRDWFVDFVPTRAKAEGRPAWLAPDLWSLFPDRLGDDGLPEGWATGAVKDHLELRYGKSLPARDRVDGRFPVYGSGGVSGTHHEKIASGPAVIVGRKGTVGTLYWENSDCYPIDTVFFVVPAISLAFSYELLASLPLRDMNTDAAVPGLNRENVYRLEVPKPPADVIRRFDAIAMDIRARIRANDEESRTLAATRDALLPKLMSGELRVRDAEALAA